MLVEFEKKILELYKLLPNLKQINSNLQNSIKSTFSMYLIFKVWDLIQQEQEQKSHLSDLIDSPS